MMRKESGSSMKHPRYATPEIDEVEMVSVVAPESSEAVVEFADMLVTSSMKGTGSAVSVQS